jgi:polygalacturonase
MTITAPMSAGLRPFSIRHLLFAVLLPFLLSQPAMTQTPGAPEDAFAVGVHAILQHIHPPAFKRASFRITSYGAIPDGKTNAKPAFDSLITFCSNGGGGTIVVPRGRYFLKGPLVLKSHIHLQLEDGAELLFSPDPQDYLPVVLTKWEGTELFNYCPQVYAYECSDIAITGKGLLNGSASGTFAHWRPQGSEEQNQLREMGGRVAPLPERVFGERAHMPPSMIQFWGCRNVLLEGFSITDAPYWVIHPVYCQNVIVRGITIRSLNLNNDGCDPESSSNVLIEHCDFTVGDDAIAIKAGRDQDAWRIGQPTENIIVRDCRFTSRTNGLCIGSEMSAGVRNVYIEHITIDRCYSAIYFKSNLDRGGYIENIHVRNVRCDSITSACIRFENNYHGGRGGHYPTLFKNFLIENVHARHSGEVGIYAVGIPGMPLQDITIRNVRIDLAPRAQIVDKVQHLTYQNVVVNGKPLQVEVTGKVKLHTD